MKKLISILSLSILLVAAGCQTSEPVTEPDSETESFSVITSFYPLYFFTSEVAAGADQVNVVNLIPSGGEPHSYEPSPSQLGQMESANLVIVQGAGLEPWLEGLEHELEHDGVTILDINSHLQLMENEEDHDEEEHEEHEEDDDHDHGEFDPHTWLDPIYAMEMVKQITDELIAMDPAQEALYSANATALSDRLLELDASFVATLSTCELDAFITSHDAFNYLATRYDLHAHAVSGISPFDEPSAHQLTELIELAEDEGVEHIFFEVLANAEAAEVLAEEAGLTPLVLNPIAGLSTDQQGEDYFSLMEANLNNLSIGLACE